MNYIAVAMKKLDSDKTVTERPNEFFIGSEGSPEQAKQSKYAYKAMLDEDARNCNDINEKSKRRQEGGGRVLQGSQSTFINYTGLTGLNVGGRNELPQAEKMRKREKYKAELDEQTKYAEHMKKVEREATKHHFSGKAPYEQG